VGAELDRLGEVDTVLAAGDAADAVEVHDPPLVSRGQ
jgi:hypothetical protein